MSLATTPDLHRTTKDCARCGLPFDESNEIISRHVTSQGLVVYSRCGCGRLRASLLSG